MTCLEPPGPSMVCKDKADIKRGTGEIPFKRVRIWKKNVLEESGAKLEKKRGILSRFRGGGGENKVKEGIAPPLRALMREITE